MAKIKLGARPVSINRTVKFDLPDGTAGQIECGFAYRTRAEFGTLVDEQAEGAGGGTPDKFSMAGALQRASAANAAYLLKILKSWDVDAELTRESLEQLADELPAAVVAMVEAYRSAIVEGRSGN